MKQIVLLFNLMVPIMAFSQINIDSLRSVFQDESLQDTVRLRAIHQIAWDGFRSTQPDSALHYSQLEYELAKSIDEKAWMARALTVQGKYYQGLRQFVQAEASFQEALQLYDDLNDPSGMVSQLTNLGGIKLNQSQLEEAITFYKKGMEMAENMGDSPQVALMANNLGTAYYQQGDYSRSLESYTAALQLSERIGSTLERANSLAGLAKNYHAQVEPDTAIAYFGRALIAFEELQDLPRIAETLNFMGNVYMGKPQAFDKAREKYEKTAEVYRSLNDIPKLTFVEGNIGLTHFFKKEYDQALPYAQRFVEFAEASGNPAIMANSLVQLGQIYHATGEYEKALALATRGEQLAEESENFQMNLATTVLLYQIHEGLGNDALALEYFKQGIDLRDSMDTEINQRTLLRKEYEYEYDKQKALDDQAFEQAKIRQQYISGGIGLGLLVVALLALLLFQRLRSTRREKLLIEAAKDKAEQSERFKERFLANMSHEIRTPMHAISGMVNILKRNQHPEQQTPFLDAMGTSARNLLVILNDVLDLSKIEAGKLHIEQIPLNPVEVAEQVIEMLRFKAEEKGLALSMTVEEDFPQQVQGDPTRLNQILTNLIGNAIKFTEEGSVRLHLQQEDGQMHFSIVDTGIGIPEEKQGEIFGSFEQADDSTTRDYGGTGLGLSITRQLVELQEGAIALESEVGKGSTFRVSLPLVKTEESKAVRTSIPESQLKAMGAEMEGLRILLAEDDPFNVMVVGDDLAWYIPEVKVETAENGLVAIDMYQKGNIDLILMDMRMPNMNGYEAAKEIRKTDPSIPIIALTASLLESEIQLCYEVGMNGYIPKPYQLDQLVGTMYEVVGEEK